MTFLLTEWAAVNERVVVGGAQVLNDLVHHLKAEIKESFGLAFRVGFGNGRENSLMVLVPEQTSSEQTRASTMRVPKSS